MNDIKQRVTNILTQPKQEWETIEQETTSIKELLTGYLLLLALIPAIGNLIGYWLVGFVDMGGVSRGGSFSMGIQQAVIAYATPVIMAFLAGYVINMLADQFNSQKDMRRAMQLVVYAQTPSLVAGIFMIVPQLSIIVTIASIYGLYILYHGLKPMMKTPDDKHTGYFVVSILVLIVISIIIGIVLTSIFWGPSIGY